MRLGCTCDRGLETSDRRGVPYDKTAHCPACYAFWHREDFNRARGGTGAVEIRRVPQSDECVYRGKLTGEIDECVTCKGRIPVPLYECSKLGKTCYKGGFSVTGSVSCARCPLKTLSDPSDPSCGIVIGSYGWPKIIEVGIKLAQRTCGAKIPILVSDDCSKNQDEIKGVCKRFGVDFVSTENRIGHCGGDNAAFYHGLVWAKKKGIEFLAKLSQRFFFTRPRWLQEGAKELQASDLPLATRKCQGKHEFPTRSEGCLLAVSKWDEERMTPQAHNPEQTLTISGEGLLASQLPGGLFWPWSEMGEDRFEKRAHEINHWANSRGEFLSLAKELGVALDPSFHSDGWEKELARGEYLFG